MTYDFTNYEKIMDIHTAVSFLDPNTRNQALHWSACCYGGVGPAMAIAQAAAKYIYKCMREMERDHKEKEMLWKTVDRLERELEQLRPQKEDGQREI